MLRVSIVTLFPELFETFLATSLVARGIAASALAVDRVDLRPFGLGKHRSVDDTPYGGGSGMVLRVEPIVGALEEIDRTAGERGEPSAHRILLTPQGAPFTQQRARALAAMPHLALVAGRYEGFDERVRSFVNEEVSIGDFVLLGGEVPAMAIVEAVARLLPGVLGNEASSASESYGEVLDGGLEYPQYTRPVDFRGLAVPDVLKNGNHREIEVWRRAESEARTTARRPDLAKRAT